MPTQVRSCVVRTCPDGGTEDLHGGRFWNIIPDELKRYGLAKSNPLGTSI